MSIAIFPSLPTGLDLAVQPIGEAIQFPGAWASINTRPISTLTKLWQRLNCYRDSLNAPDRQRYCREKTAFFNTVVECEGHRCPVPCRFVCAPCLRSTQDQPTIDVESRFAAATALAEIAWCPNLGLSDRLMTPAGAELPERDESTGTGRAWCASADIHDEDHVPC